MSVVMEELVGQEVAEKKPKVRLRGYIHRYAEQGQFGFITVPGTNGKQWHFHRNSMRKQGAEIAAGLVVEFTPMPCAVEGKRDKATDIEVVG